MLGPHPSPLPGYREREQREKRFVLGDGAPLVRNLGALWATDPGVAGEVERELMRGVYAVEMSKAGGATVALENGAGRKIYLHSRHQPMEEAKRLIDTVEVAKRVVFFVHGFGLGYHVEELFERAGDESLIVVLEPDVRLIATALSERDYSKLIESGRVIFITREERASLVVKLTPHQAMVSLGPAVVAHGPSVQVRGEFHAQMKVWVEEFRAYAKTNINTLVLNGRRTAENIAKNLAWYAAAPGINRLRARHAGKPAIIVSAGPSLRKNQHLLKEAQGKAVIIAVQTTLQPLLDMGIEPDYATSLDYHDICTRFFERLPKGLKTELVAEPKASAAVFGLYPGPLTLLGNELADKLLKPMAMGKDRLRAGATVAHLAFYLAEFMGSDPIIFVGQDLGFSDGLAYTPGTSYEDVWRPELGRFCTVEMRQWEHIARERPILRRIPDSRGGMMYTEERLFAYLQQFERDFATTRARVIDATEGGALKRGAHVMTLADALTTHCTLPLAATPRDHGGLAWERVGHVGEHLRKRREEALMMKSISQQTLPLLEGLVDGLNDQAKVNRTIAKIDGLRAKMLEVNDCYEVATQLTQQAELARFRRDRELSASKAQGVEKQRLQLLRDVENVKGVIEAAEEFVRLVDEVIETIQERDSVSMGRAA